MEDDDKQLLNTSYSISMTSVLLYFPSIALNSFYKNYNYIRNGFV